MRMAIAASMATLGKQEQAKAARRLIIVEKPSSDRKRFSAHPNAPSFRATASKPSSTSLSAPSDRRFGCYDYDAAHLKLYVEHPKRDRIGDYIDTYIAEHGPSRISQNPADMPHLAKLKADPVLGY